MCDIVITKNAAKTLKELGCNRKRFLRLSTQSDNLNFQALIDSTLYSTDEILIDKPDLRVVGSAQDVGALDGLKVDFKQNFTFTK